jgi:Spherulation-specific family 4
MNRRTGIVIPLYVYPSNSTSWNALTDAKENFPNVPLVAVVNPDNGPGSLVDGNYLQGIANLKKSRILVLGYISTRYGRVNLKEAARQVLQYQQWYDLDGIFFDEMSSVSGFEDYYSELSSYAKDLGLSVTFGNPGTSVSPSYFGTVDTIIVYENRGYPRIEAIRSVSSKKFDKLSFGIMAINVGPPSSKYLIEVSRNLGFVYFTNGDLPDPYSSITPYLNETLSALALL